MRRRPLHPHHPLAPARQPRSPVRRPRTRLARPQTDHDRKIRAHHCQLHALIGTVSYISQRAAAEAAVAGLAGVRNVINDIEVSYVMDPANVDVNVQQALERSALVPAAT